MARRSCTLLYRQTMKDELSVMGGSYRKPVIPAASHRETHVRILERVSWKLY